MNRRYFLSSALAVGTVAALSRLPIKAAQQQSRNHNGVKGINKGVKKMTKTNVEWKQILTPQQYDVTRNQGTEAPYSSPLNSNHEHGVFECVCCQLPLFNSEAKFDSGTGWPSFWAPIAKENVQEKTDNTLGMTRTEVECARCDAHIGHVFDDGPKPTGLRYCMNGVALKFVPKA